jgi:hypothetical protein
VVDGLAFKDVAEVIDGVVLHEGLVGGRGVR